MEKLIITAAICGAEVTKKHNPAVPYTVEEMVREAKSAFEAGAAGLPGHGRAGGGSCLRAPARKRFFVREVTQFPATAGRYLWPPAYPGS